MFSAVTMTFLECPMNYSVARFNPILNGRLNEVDDYGFVSLTFVDDQS